MRVMFLALGLVAASPAWAYLPGKAALVQYKSDRYLGYKAWNTNTKNLTAYALRAVKEGANLIVFPEGGIYGYDDGKYIWCRPGLKKYSWEDQKRNCLDVSRVAESAREGISAQYWRKFAAEHGVHILFNILEKDGARFYNTNVAISPSGETQIYRKRTLYAVEQAYAQAGTSPTVWSTPYGRFGLLICIDGSDSDDPALGGEFDFGYYREYQGLGVNAILMPMNWANQDPQDSWSSKNIFENRAARYRFDLYVADAWDGTAKYLAVGGERERNGLPHVGAEGISYHLLRY